MSLDLLDATMKFLEILLQANQNNASANLKFKVQLLSSVDLREMNVFASEKSTMDNKSKEDTNFLLNK